MRPTFSISILFSFFVLTLTWIPTGRCQEKTVILKLGHAVAPVHPYEGVPAHTDRSRRGSG